jgi:hypothetical protein
MSMSRKALKLVQKALPELYLCKDKLVLPPTEHILRGFVFERTPYKETFYLWRLVLPLYRYHSRENLDYSARIPRGAYVHLSREAPDRTAAEVTRIISEDIPNLEKIRTPRDFLDHVGWMVGNDSPAFLLDLAMTYFMVDRVDDAVASLRQVGVETGKLIAYYAAPSGPDSPIVERLTEIRRVAGHLAEQMQADLAAAAKTISDWERKNILAFELGGTAVETATT